MYGYVYLTTNLVNGRKYVGQHKSSEFTENYKGSGKLVSQAFIKYGWDNFKVELLEECETKEELDKCEIKWIKELNAVYSDEYYNIAFGGNSRHGPISDEHRKRLSEVGKLRVGPKNPFYGKRLSQESKDKRVKAFKATVSRQKSQGTYKVNSGYMIYNNGVREIHLTSDSQVPEGFVHGRLPYSQETIQKMSESHKNISEETRLRMSESQKNSNRTYEDRRQNQLDYISTLTDEEFNKRYVVPRLKENLSQEIISKMSSSASSRNQGRVWINDCVSNKFIKSEDLSYYKEQGYSVGRLQDNSGHKGTFFINNGKINKMIHEGEEIPEGWKKGMIRRENQESVSC